MDDAELQAIRKARLAELQKGSSQSGDGKALLSSILSQVLEPQARERLSRVSMVRPDRAKAVEEYIMKLSQTGQLRRKMTEQELVQILNGIARDEEGLKETKIIFDRKNAANSYAGEDDDDDDFFD